jgi:hypothetical protein
MTDCIWIHYARPRPHWYELDEARQTTLQRSWDDVRDLATAEGAVRVGGYHIRGNHDFETVEIWRFATPEAAFEHWVKLTLQGYNEWFAYENNIGFGVES